MSLISRLRDKVLNQKNKRARSDKAREWYKDLTKNVLKKGNLRSLDDYLDSDTLNKQASSARKIMRDEAFKVKSISKVDVGKMYMYQYDAKHKNDKNKLPYWDVFPLAIIIDVQDDYFLTMNIHYIRPDHRLVLLDELYALKSNRNNDEYTKINFNKIRDEEELAFTNYQLLSKASKSRYYKPCIKKHLISHIKSEATLIAPKFWDLVVFLPTELFVGASTSKVWSDSEKKF